MADIPAFWRQKTILTWLLLPLAWLFGMAAAWRKRRLQASAQQWRAAQDVQAKILVVGNLSVGGNGKTPVVIAAARALQAKGFAVAVISRGYGGTAKQVMAVDADTDAALCGDEPKLIAMAADCPVIVGKARQKAVEYVLRHFPQTQWIISDDGLQHYALPRDAEWLVVAPDLRLGNGFLLPAGPLRESPARLQTVDAILFSGEAAHFCDCRPAQYCLKMHNTQWQTLAAETLPLAEIQNQVCAVLTAIARPERFLQRVQALGIRPSAVSLLADHQALPSAAADFAPADSLLLMTGKDAVKTHDWPAALRARVRVLQYKAELPPELLECLLDSA